AGPGARSSRHHPDGPTATRPGRVGPPPPAGGADGRAWPARARSAHSDRPPDSSRTASPPPETAAPPGAAHRAQAAPSRAPAPRAGGPRDRPWPWTDADTPPGWRPPPRRAAARPGADRPPGRPAAFRGTLAHRQARSPGEPDVHSPPPAGPGGAGPAPLS